MNGSERPYLSVVATARNDNHGGDLLDRMQVFVNALAGQADRFELPIELVLVEWNPPADRPGLAEALDWPDSSFCEFRIIRVPHERHMLLEHANALPLFQMIAKNVGIRRTRGEFVLATNVDILFSDALMRRLAQRDLRPDRFYRVDRHDVAIAPDPALDLDTTLQLAAGHVIRICGRMGTTDLVTGDYYRIYENVRLPLTARRVLHISRVVCRRVTVGTRTAAHVTRGGTRYLMYGAISALRGRPPARVVNSAERLRLQLNPVGLVKALARSLHRNARALRIMWEAEAATLALHTNASGDFTLLSRTAWESTLAYPELELFSMHIDGLFLYQAHYAGLSEEWLPQPLFHIEHDHGFKPRPNEVKELNDRLERASISQVSFEQFSRWVLEMSRTGRPLGFNDDRWGFAGETLEEVEMHAGSGVTVG